MTTRTKLIKNQQISPVFGGSNGIQPPAFGNECIYNPTYKLLIVSAPHDKYDLNNQNWLTQGSGSVYIYSYNETTGEITLVQKISQPNSSVTDMASVRHGYANFGFSIDTWAQWLIIGCPGDQYKATLSLGSPASSTNFTFVDILGQQTPTTEGPTGSVYFYKWNGTSFDYVNKVCPPVFSDFSTSNDFVEYDWFPTLQEDTNYHYGLFCGDGSNFGSSVSIDKSASTSLSTSNYAIKKYVAIGAPNAKSIPTLRNQNNETAYKGPVGGVWIATYNTTTLKWQLLTNKLTLYSYGGQINQAEIFGNFGSDNFQKDEDFLGFSNISTSYEITDSPNNQNTPETASDAKCNQNYSKFGSKVSLNYYGGYNLIVGDSGTYVSTYDNYGLVARRGNVYYFDMVYDPSAPLAESMILRNPYGNRQVYTAFDKNGFYGESIFGYSSFLDGDAVADTFNNVQNSVKNSYISSSRPSAGFCTYPAITGSSLATENGTDYVVDSRLSRGESQLCMGETAIQQAGRLAFISAPDLRRVSNTIYSESDTYEVTDYETGYDGYGDTGKKVAMIEECPSILIVDMSDSEQIKTKGWILSPPNNWTIQSGQFSWTGFFGFQFSVYQESSTQWVLATTYVVDYEKEYYRSGSPINDYIYKVKKGQLKTVIYRITYDGTNMSMSLINVLDGKIIEGPQQFNNDCVYEDEMIKGSSISSSSVPGSVYMRRISPISLGTNFNSFFNTPCPALINNTVQNNYHIAEGWHYDNDGSVVRSGTLNLTSFVEYEINGSAFISFCE